MCHDYHFVYSSTSKTMIATSRAFLSNFQHGFLQSISQVLSHGILIRGDHIQPTQPLLQFIKEDKIHSPMFLDTRGLPTSLTLDPNIICLRARQIITSYNLVIIIQYGILIACENDVFCKRKFLRNFHENKCSYLTCFEIVQ